MDDQEIRIAALTIAAAVTDWGRDEVHRLTAYADRLVPYITRPPAPVVPQTWCGTVTSGHDSTTVSSVAAGGVSTYQVALSN